MAATDTRGLDELAVASLVAGEYSEDATYRVTRRRGAASWLLILTTGGAGWARTQGDPVELGVGRLALLAPDVPHDYGTDSAWDLCWVHFRARDWWQDLLRWAPQSPGLAVLDLGADDARCCLDGMRAARRAVEGGGRFADDLGLAHLETVVLVAARAGDALGNRDERVVAAVAHLHRAVVRPYSADALAAVMHLSPGRAAKLFTAEVGRSPQQYSTRLKMERARRMLELSDLPVARVARATGYEDESYFIRRFHVEVGVAPGVYRRQHRWRADRGLSGLLPVEGAAGGPAGAGAGGASMPR